MVHSTQYPPPRADGDASGYGGEWVADVVLARANGAIMRRLFAQQALLRKLESTRASVRRYAPGSPEANPRKYAKMMAALEKLEARIRKLMAASKARYSSDVVAAFVTFNNEASMLRCTSDYSGSTSALRPAYWWQPDPLRFGGTKRLSVRRAPDPSVIQWQNLDVSPCTRFARRAAANAVIAVLLIVSLAFIVVSQGFQNSFRTRMPNLAYCAATIPSAAYGLPVLPDGSAAATLPTDWTYVKDASDAACTTAGGVRFVVNSTTSPQWHTSATSSSPCTNDCYFPGADATRCVYNTTRAGVAVSYTRDTVVGCYCIAQLRDVLASAGTSVFAATRNLYLREKRYCGDFFTVRLNLFHRAPPPGFLCQ